MIDAATHTTEGFTQRFGCAPDGLWCAPGRVNLIGEHTDYNDGFVMPIAIDRATYVAARRRDDAVIACSSAAFGDVPPVGLDALAPGSGSTWAAYVHGVVAALREHIGDMRGMDLFVWSDVPAGAGLSSSAALSCATAVAVAGLHGAALAPIELALAAQRAEHSYAGVPCGIMDQMAAMLGSAGHALLIDTRAHSVEPVPLTLPAHRILVIDTGVSHALADGAYADRRRACERAAAILNVDALRDATPAMLDAAAEALGPELYRRARHVVTENARVHDAARVLREGNLSALGHAMAGSHTSLRDDYEVSIAQLDVAVETAVAAGAIGARMTGGGFGGSAIAIVPNDALRAVEHEVTEAFAARGFAAPRLMLVSPSDGARRVR